MRLNKKCRVSYMRSPVFSYCREIPGPGRVKEQTGPACYMEGTSGKQLLCHIRKSVVQDVFQVPDIDLHLIAHFSGAE